MNTTTRTAAAVCAAGICVNVWANEPSQPANPEDVMVVTATRAPVPANRVIAPMDIVDRGAIERSMAVELGELLRFQTGLDVVRTGGPGQQTSVFTRGTNSNQTLVLIDGVRINSGGLGLAAVQNITPEMIERVEIVKAPRTSLYGENAIGGVINVITRTPDGPQVSAFGGGGQDDTLKLGAAAGTQIGGFGISGRAQRLTTEGYPIVEGATFDSGWDNTTLQGKVSYDSDRWGLEGRFWRSDGTDEFVSYPIVPASQDYENQIIALAGRVTVAENWESALDLSFNIDDLRQRQFNDYAKTNRAILDWQNTVGIGNRHTLVAGVYLSNEEVTGESFGFPLVAEDTDTAAVFAEDTMIFGRNVIVLAGRYSDHDAIGADFTWNVEYGFDLSDTMRLTANGGRAVRAPSASERFGPFGGNPNLNEEDATTVQAGWQWTMQPGQELRLDWFHTEIDNLIASDENFELQNIDAAEIDGIEAAYSFVSVDWSVRVAGKLQNPENQTTGSTLLRRSKASATISVVRQFGAHQFGANMQFVGSRKDFGDQDLPGYGLTNLTGQVAITDYLAISGRIENLFDRNYTPAYYDFGTPFVAQSRGAYVELRYNMY